MTTNIVDLIGWLVWGEIRTENVEEVQQSPGQQDEKPSTGR